MTGALVVDFDGVVCDALEECALITWLGLHGVDPDLPVSSYLRAVPDRFMRKFSVIRNFARTLDDFGVAHAGRGRSPRSRAEFEQMADSLPLGFIAAFVRQANDARQRCRTEEPQFWLNLHSLYPGVPELLRTHSGGVYIITAKDAGSVWSILRAQGLMSTVREVYGEVSAKDEVMLKLCASHGVDVADAVFVDDNLTNVERVATVGARAFWATWGYHTPEDLRRADASGVERLDLTDLPKLRVPQ